MNIERLREIAEWLEEGAPARYGVEGFNMKNAIVPSECGTICCIAGAAVQFDRAGKRMEPIKSLRSIFDEHLFVLDRPIVMTDVFNAAADILGLTRRTANCLFFGLGRKGNENCYEWNWTHWSLASITPEIAARTIRHFIATGDINWNLTS